MAEGWVGEEWLSWIFRDKSGSRTGALCCSLWMNEWMMPLDLHWKLGSATCIPASGPWLSSRVWNSAPTCLHRAEFLHYRPGTLHYITLLHFPWSIYHYLTFSFLICLFTYLVLVSCAWEQKLYVYAKQSPRDPGSAWPGRSSVLSNECSTLINKETEAL